MCHIVPCSYRSFPHPVHFSPGSIPVWRCHEAPASKGPVWSFLPSVTRGGPGVTKAFCFSISRPERCEVSTDWQTSDSQVWWFQNSNQNEYYLYLLNMVSMHGLWSHSLRKKNDMVWIWFANTRSNFGCSHWESHNSSLQAPGYTISIHHDSLAIHIETR